MILGCDPGTYKTAYVLLNPASQQIETMGIEDNEALLKMFRVANPRITVFAIEHIASFGFTVGQEVMETIRWEGRFEEAMRRQDVIFYPVRRKQVLAHFGAKNDSTLRGALIRRFGSSTGCVYDLWSALGISACASDRLKGGFHAS